MGYRILERILIILAYPIFIGMEILEELIGEGRWYRRQRQQMTQDRPPLEDSEFLQAIQAIPTENHIWLAIRQAVADSINVPATAIYPSDSLAVLWRMQLLGPDHLDIIFRLERTLGVKINRNDFDLTDMPSDDIGVFHQYSHFMVRVLGRALGRMG